MGALHRRCGSATGLAVVAGVALSWRTRAMITRTRIARAVISMTLVRAASLRRLRLPSACTPTFAQVAAGPQLHGQKLSLAPGAASLPLASRGADLEARRHHEV